MNHREKENLSELKKIYLFKHFIKFLEIYGQEAFGENYPVKWGLVHNIICDHSIWSMDEELDDIIYNSEEDLDSDAFRDKVFSYIEKQVIDGYPIFRLFNLSPWLNKCFEDEIDRKIYDEDKKWFNKHLCYKCKHFKDNIDVYMGNPSMNIRGTPFYPLEDFKEYYPTLDIKKQRLRHNRLCDLHSQYLKQFEEYSKDKHYFSDEKLREFNKWVDKNNLAKSTKYPPNENGSMFNPLSHEYYLIPLSARTKCSCYEPIEDYDFDKFLEKYIELR